MKSKWIYGLISLMLILNYGLMIQNDDTHNRETALVQGQIAYIIDGDTLIVSIEGQRKKVRLIGVDTPEIGEEGYLKATQFLKNLLPVGTLVYLESDLHDVDKYNRLLRYVWLIPEPHDFKAHCLTGLLLSNHLGVPLWMNGDIKYQSLTE